MTSSRTVKRGLVRAAAVLVAIIFSLGSLAAQSKAPATRDALVSVSGMSCEAMCAPTLQKRLAKLPDVKAVVVSAEKGTAVITFALPTKVQDKEIEQAVADAGFKATKIEWQRRAS